MPNYQEGKIYKIYNTINDDIYIGSTTQKLCDRMREHRDRHRNEPPDALLYKAFAEYGIDNFFIELIEKCPCNDIEELRRKEGEYMKLIKSSLNTYLAGRTRQEYRDTHKEQKATRMKTYREMNKQKINERNAEKVTCECGCVVSNGYLSRHRQSKKHIELMKDKLN